MKLGTILLITALFSPLAFADPHPGDDPVGGARNKDGSFVTAVLTAAFDPSNGVSPFPNNLAFIGTEDLTLNIGVPDPTDNGDPLVSLNGLDGWSTTEKWVTTFLSDDGISGTPATPGAIDPASVVPGQSVRVFQVTHQSFVAVTGIVRELTPGVDYFAASAPGGVVAILPLKPLPEYSTFMAVLTNDITDVDGNNATPSQTYYLSKRRTPWIDANFNSVNTLLDNATAQRLEGLRQLTLSMEFAAASAGVNPDDIVLAWTVQTQSITPTLKLLRSIAAPAPVTAAPTGLTTAAIGAFGLADIVIGVITLPYYLTAPSAENPFAPLTEFWRAAPGAYVPPFDQFGLDPTSTNLTVANPFPVPTGMQTVPFIMTVPNANSGQSKPDGGWPVVIYQHGITRNRTDMLAVADSMALGGLAVIAIDQPLHGVVPAVAPELAPFYIENTPFAPIANERTFDADYWNNATGALGPDGIPDSSGTSSFNLGNLRVARDNLRQATADLSVLAVTLQNISVDGDATPDLNAFNVGALIHSLGTTVGVPFLAIEPIVSRGYLNAATGALIRTGVAGDFGERVNAGLAAEGIFPGTADYELFLTAAQTVVDAGDGINWGLEAALKMPIIHNQVQGDTTVPNSVLGAPTAGSEAMNLTMGLEAYSSTQVNPDGLRGVARFQYGQHSSLFIPIFPEITAEMQGQAATFLASGGTFVNVGDSSLLVPVVEGSVNSAAQPQSDRRAKKKKRGPSPGSRLDAVQPLPELGPRRK